MLINLNPNADVDRLKKALAGLGLWVNPLLNGDGLVQAILVKNHSTSVDRSILSALPGVASVFEHVSNHPEVDKRRGKPLPLSKTTFSASSTVLIAGPCSIESADAINEIARAVATAGGSALRGGAFKPRTSPYAFSGFGHAALKWMRQAADENGLDVVTEVMSELEVEHVADVADMLQIGSRNMQNFALLHQVGKTKKPILLKRGRAATVEEWLMAGEHLYAAGAESVLFCERGVRGFDDSTRNLLDLSAVALLRHHYGLNVIVDPSHACGRRDLIIPLANAAMAAGASGVMVEVHPRPSEALSDAPQALDLENLQTLASGMNLEPIS
jgi:3-deoxy-7-phosphoheptulonate synthase